MELETNFADWARALRTSFFALASCILLSRSCSKGSRIVELIYKTQLRNLKIQALSVSQIESGENLARNLGISLPQRRTQRINTSFSVSGILNRQKLVI